MSDFEQTSPLDTPDDGWYLSDAEMDAMTADELEAAFALALDSMTEDTYDGEVISRFLDAMDRKDPMPEHPNVETSYAGFQKKMNSVSSHEEPAEPMIRPRRVRRVSRALLAAAVSVWLSFSAACSPRRPLGSMCSGRWRDGRMTSSVSIRSGPIRKPAMLRFTKIKHQPRNLRLTLARLGKMVTILRSMHLCRMRWTPMAFLMCRLRRIGSRMVTSLWELKSIMTARPA